MKSGKILLGIFILISFSKEAFNAYYQTKDTVFFYFLIISAITLCAILFRSAFKETSILRIGVKHSEQIWKFVKIISILGIITVIVPKNLTQPPKYVIEENGINIPLDRCVDAFRKHIGLEAEEFCNCIAVNMANNSYAVEHYQLDLMNGSFLRIISNYKDKGELDKIGVQDCFDRMKYNQFWNEESEVEIKALLKSQVQGTYLEEVNDLNKYCECLIDSLKTFPIDLMISGEFRMTENYIRMEYNCKQTSRK